MFWQHIFVRIHVVFYNLVRQDHTVVKYEECSCKLLKLLGTLINSLAKGGYFFSSVGLSVCLLVANIIKKVINGLQ